MVQNGIIKWKQQQYKYVYATYGSKIGRWIVGFCMDIGLHFTCHWPILVGHFTGFLFEILFQEWLLLKTDYFSSGPENIVKLAAAPAHQQHAQAFFSFP